MLGKISPQKGCLDIGMDSPEGGGVTTQSGVTMEMLKESLDLVPWSGWHGEVQS